MLDAPLSVKRGVFLGSAAALVVGTPAAGRTWPREELNDECDKPTKDDDVDAPWHPVDKNEDGNKDVNAGTALTLAETRELAREFVLLLIDDSDLRDRYYHFVRTYKKRYYHSSDQKGGKYGHGYVQLLKEKLNPPRDLQLNDIANLHLAAVLYLRRALLALTAHDVDPGATQEGSAITKSFHFGPNDGSSYSFTASELANAYAP
jgi:hypothetical protein